MSRITSVGVKDIGRPFTSRFDDRFAVVARAGDVTGWYGPVARMPASLIAGGLGAMAVGWEATDHRPLYRHLWGSLELPPSGVRTWALGALDCAVWDLHGKLANLPVATLLASETPRAEVSVYGSWLSLDLYTPTAPEEVCRVAAQGFCFTKWALRRRETLSPATDAAAAMDILHKVATDVGGVAVDALGTWDVPFARAFVRRVDPGAIRWLEDPLDCEDPYAYTEFASRCRVPLALGERTHGPAEILRLVGAVTPDAITIDIAWTGGLTPSLDVLAIARAAAVPVYPHGRTFLPALHLAAASPDIIPAVEYQIQWEPRRQALIGNPGVPNAGRVVVSDGPGFGSFERNP